MGGGISLLATSFILFIKYLLHSHSVRTCWDSLLGCCGGGHSFFFLIYKYIWLFYAFKFIGMLTAVHWMSLSPLGLEVTISSAKDLVKSL